MSSQVCNSFNQKRIAMFEPHPDLATNPSLVCLLEAFTRGGARLDVLMPDGDRFPQVKALATRYPFPRRFSLWRGGVRSTLRGWLSWLEHIRDMEAERAFAAGAYDLILGINSAGIIRGYEYAKRYDVPLVYLSFEIFFRDELSLQAEIKEKERECIASGFTYHRTHRPGGFKLLAECLRWQLTAWIKLLWSVAARNEIDRVTLRARSAFAQALAAYNLRLFRSADFRQYVLQENFLTG